MTELEDILEKTWGNRSRALVSVFLDSHGPAPGRVIAEETGVNPSVPSYLVKRQPHLFAFDQEEDEERVYRLAVDLDVILDLIDANLSDQTKELRDLRIRLRAILRHRRNVRKVTK